MNTMNAMSKETNKTQAMLYLENKRKMAETGQTANVSGEKTEIISIPIYKLNTTYTSQRTLRNRRLAENIASNFDKNLFQPIVLLWYHTVMVSGMLLMVSIDFTVRRNVLGTITLWSVRSSEGLLSRKNPCTLSS